VAWKQSENRARTSTLAGTAQGALCKIASFFAMARPNSEGRPAATSADA